VGLGDTTMFFAVIRDKLAEECDSCGKSLKNEPAACQEQGLCDPCLEQAVRSQADWGNGAELDIDEWRLI